MRHRAGNGAELLDWQEVWCNRCVADHGFHHPESGDGCEIMARGLVDQGAVNEWIDGGYTIVFRDEARRALQHEIPNVSNSLPAATICTAWKPCAPDCMTHPNGAQIVDLTPKVETK